MMKYCSAVCFLFVFVVPPAVIGADVELRAGAAAVDVTPQAFPLNMPGGFSANMATSAHDPFHARALVLDDGATTVALVVVDNLGAAPEVLEEAKQIASKATGLAT